LGSAEVQSAPFEPKQGLMRFVSANTSQFGISGNFF
jgi:hypothetical protein